MSKKALIAKLISEGKTTKEISNITGLSIHGVRYYRQPSKKIQNHRRKIKRKAIDYSGGCCLNCGYKTSVSALTFHHLDPEEKEFEINANSVGWNRAKLEVNKTLLLCRNCHAELHDYLWIPSEVMILKQNAHRNNYVDIPLKNYK